MTDEQRRIMELENLAKEMAQIMYAMSTNMLKLGMDMAQLSGRVDQVEGIKTTIQKNNTIQN